MSCLQVSLDGIPPEHLQGLSNALGTQASEIVEQFDVFTGERFVLRCRQGIATDQCVSPQPQDAEASSASVAAVVNLEAASLARSGATRLADSQRALLNLASLGKSAESGDALLVNSVSEPSLRESLSLNLGSFAEDRVPALIQRTQDVNFDMHEIFASQPIHTIVLKIRPQYLTTLIKIVKTCGVGEDFGSIDVTDIRCTTHQPPDRSRKHNTDELVSRWSKCIRKIQFFSSTALDRMSTLEIHASIVTNSYISVNHVACIIIASGIAAVGLLTNSSTFVLAAFFISPLMHMILAVVWGFTVNKKHLAFRGFRNMIFGATLCILNGILVGILVSLVYDEKSLRTALHDDGISINTLQISSRGPPAGNVIMSAVVAALSGVAIALGQGSGIASALTGVCISTSLLPPLVNAGMMFSIQSAYPKLCLNSGYSLKEVGCFSLYLYLANIVCIIVFAWAAFKFKHIGGTTLRPMYRRAGTATPSSDTDPDELLCAFAPKFPMDPEPSRDV